MVCLYSEFQLIPNYGWPVNQTGDFVWYQKNVISLAPVLRIICLQVVPLVLTCFIGNILHLWILGNNRNMLFTHTHTYILWPWNYWLTRHFTTLLREATWFISVGHCNWWRYLRGSCCMFPSQCLFQGEVTHDFKPLSHVVTFMLFFSC